jgi:hypothetical protein
LKLFKTYTASQEVDDSLDGLVSWDCIQLNFEEPSLFPGFLWGWRLHHKSEPVSSQLSEKLYETSNEFE